MPQILAKLFSLGGNPISDRLYSNLASPGKHEKELRRQNGNYATQQSAAPASAEDEKLSKKSR